MDAPADPLFLEVAQVIQIHEEQMALYTSESGAIAVLSPEGLESAVMAPRFLWLYDNDADIFDLAARYCSHLALNHPFQDGNKRTALATALQFLYVNGLDLTRRKACPEECRITDEDIAQLVIGLIEKRTTEEDMAHAFFVGLGPAFISEQLEECTKLSLIENPPPPFRSQDEADAWWTDLSLAQVAAICIDLCQQLFIHPKRLNAVLGDVSSQAISRVKEEFHAPFGLTVTKSQDS